MQDTNSNNNANLVQDFNLMQDTNLRQKCKPYVRHQFTLQTPVYQQQYIHHLAPASLTHLTLLNEQQCETLCKTPIQITMQNLRQRTNRQQLSNNTPLHSNTNTHAPSHTHTHTHTHTHAHTHTLTHEKRTMMR